MDINLDWDKDCTLCHQTGLGKDVDGRYQACKSCNGTGRVPTTEGFALAEFLKRYFGIEPLAKLPWSEGIKPQKLVKNPLLGAWDESP